MAKPSKGKRFVKVIRNSKTGRIRKVSYGQVGRARSGGDRIKRGTAKGDAYCSRSAGINKKYPRTARDPNSPNNLSRRKWGCRGKRSSR